MHTSWPDFSEVATSLLNTTSYFYMYCKTFNIWGIKFSQFNENDIMAYFNFGDDDIPWLQMVKKILCKFVTFFS